MSGVTGRGLTDGNASAADETIFVQPASIEPSHVGFAATLPALHAYASKDRSPTRKFPDGTHGLWTIGCRLWLERAMQRFEWGAPVRAE